MGRRKIEIQPITNERNRSVTFLKRKNGLFKKAHELGVLCSVDVAVIIFDERHGHDTKLFQYCSTDIRDVVQRHLRHNGERDTRGPADFSDVPGGAKNDNTGDADDDDDDANGDDVLPPIKKESTGRNKDDEEFKPSARVITEPGSKNRAPIPYERHTSDRARPSMTLPTFPPIPQYDHQHPVSSDRLYPLHHQRPYQDQPQNKKPRLDYPLNLNTTHIPRHGDHGHPLSATSSDGHGLGDDPVYMYHPSQSQQFRQTHRVPSEPNNSHPHHHHHPQHHSQYPQYHAPYPPSPPPSHHGHSQSYDQSSFGPPQSDFPLGPQISSWGRSHGSNGPGSASNPPSGLSFFSSSGAIGPSSYDGISEAPFPRGDDGRENNNNNNGSSDKTTRDTFASAFLEAEQQRKVTLPQSGLSLPRPTTSAASFGLDWPTHVRPPPPPPPPPQQQQAAAAPAPPPAPPTAAPPSSDAAALKSDTAGEDAETTAAAAADANLGWLDLLSAGTPGTTVPPSSEGGTVPSPRSGSADTLASGAGT